MTGRLLETRLEQEPDPVRRMEIIEQALCPCEPQLLDTCVVQNLDWVDRQLEPLGRVVWDEAAVAGLVRQYGADLANDLIDLGTLYKEFESRGGYPWLVCETAEAELIRLQGPKAQRLASAFRFFFGHQEDWCIDAYPGIAQGLLFGSPRRRVSPLILRGLGVGSPEDVSAADGPLSFLPDLGDRLVAATALMANIPAVLTTDLASFWQRRTALSTLGLDVVRPSELLQLYEPYWSALDAEFARRQAATE